MPKIKLNLSKKFQLPLGTVMSGAQLAEHLKPVEKGAQEGHPFYGNQWSDGGGGGGKDSGYKQKGGGVDKLTVGDKAGEVEYNVAGQGDENSSIAFWKVEGPMKAAVEDLGFSLEDAGFTTDDGESWLHDDGRSAFVEVDGKNLQVTITHSRGAGDQDED
jgi:hypothetical protein